MIKNNNNQYQTKLDTTDTQIIKTLQNNGRKSYRQIAKELELSVGTITNRVNKLKNEGIIKGFQLELDYKQLGYNIETVIELEADGSIDNIIEKYPENIITSHRKTGQYNTLLITRFKDTQELNQFLEMLEEEKNVNKTYTQLILESINT